MGRFLKHFFHPYFMYLSLLLVASVVFAVVPFFSVIYVTLIKRLKVIMKKVCKKKEVLSTKKSKNTLKELR